MSLHDEQNLTDYLEGVFGLIIEPDSDSFYLTNWHAIDATSFQCPKCGISSVIVFCSNAKTSLEGICLICTKDKKVFWPDSLSVKLRDKLKELFKEFINKENIMNWPVEEMLKTIIGSSKSEGTSTNSAGSDDAGFAPKGYRHVAWIRLAEAQAAIEAYENKKTITTKYPDNSARGEARFYENDSPECKKYLANVHVVRLRKTGERWVGWIRKEEAEAVIQAMELKSDVSFAHSQNGKGGLVKYFSTNSESAKKYRSQTRLLRRS